MIGRNYSGLSVVKLLPRAQAEKRDKKLLFHS